MKVPKKKTLYVGAKRLNPGAEIKPGLENQLSQDVLKKLKPKTAGGGSGGGSGGGGGGTTKP